MNELGAFRLGVAHGFGLGLQDVVFLYNFSLVVVFCIVQVGIVGLCGCHLDAVASTEQLS